MTECAREVTVPVRPFQEARRGEEGVFGCEASDEDEQNDEYRAEQEPQIDMDVEDVTGEEVKDESSSEGARPKVKRKPRLPTKQEREEHEATHIPFRSWCRHCVRGRVRNLTLEAAHARRAWARGREEGPLRGRPRHEEPG